jgi:multisubunit Na+/H+ antiporter MnhE subunit
MNLRLSLLEIFLLEVVVWLGLWLLNDYLATLLTLIIGAIVSAALVVALVAEAIERSRVPRKYFYVMLLSVVAPAVAGFLYLFIFEGDLNFLR